MAIKLKNEGSFGSSAAAAAAGGDVRRKQAAVTNAISGIQLTGRQKRSQRFAEQQSASANKARLEELEKRSQLGREDAKMLADIRAEEKTVDFDRQGQRLDEQRKFQDEQARKRERAGLISQASSAGLQMQSKEQAAGLAQEGFEGRLEAKRADEAARTGLPEGLDPKYWESVPDEEMLNKAYGELRAVEDNRGILSDSEYSEAREKAVENMRKAQQGSLRRRKPSPAEQFKQNTYRDPRTGDIYALDEEGRPTGKPIHQRPERGLSHSDRVAYRKLANEQAMVPEYETDPETKKRIEVGKKFDAVLAEQLYQGYIGGSGREEPVTGVDESLSAIEGGGVPFPPTEGQVRESLPSDLPEDLVQGRLSEEGVLPELDDVRIPKSDGEKVDVQEVAPLRDIPSPDKAFKSLSPELAGISFKGKGFKDINRFDIKEIADAAGMNVQYLDSAYMNYTDNNLSVVEKNTAYKNYKKRLLEALSKGGK